jgi:hypothetical protein
VASLACQPAVGGRRRVGAVPRRGRRVGVPQDAVALQHMSMITCDNHGSPLGPGVVEQGTQRPELGDVPAGVGAFPAVVERLIDGVDHHAYEAVRVAERLDKSLAERLAGAAFDQTLVEQPGRVPLASGASPDVTRRIYKHVLRKVTAKQVEKAAKLLTRHRPKRKKGHVSNP